MHTTLRATLLGALVVLGGVTSAHGLDVVNQDLATLQGKLPAGSKLLYTHAYVIHVVDIQTLAETTYDDYAYQFARWSFDGDKIAAVAAGKVYVLDDLAAADGGARSLNARPSLYGGITIEFHPNNTEILYVKESLRAVDINTMVDRLVAAYHPYDGEPCASLVTTAGGEVKRVGARVSHDLYAIDMVAGTDRLFHTELVCSPVLPPDGSRLGNNTGTHTAVAFRDWDGSRYTEIDAVDPIVTGGAWDNFHWSNHPDFLAIQGDDSAESVDAYVMDISDFSTPKVTRVTSYVGTGDTGMRNPDLWIPDVIGISGEVTVTGSSPTEYVQGAELKLTGPTGTVKTITDADGKYAMYAVFTVGGSYTMTAPGITIDSGGAAFTYAADMTHDLEVTLDNSDAAANDTLPDYWERRHFDSITSAEDDTGDSDGDGLTNIQEYEGNTSPVVPTIVPNPEEDWSGCVPGSYPYGGLIMLALTGLGIALLRRRAAVAAAVVLAVIVSAPALAAAPRGKPARKTSEEEELAAAIGQQLDAKIVWSTSRDNGYHNIYIMDEDGQNKRKLTDSARNVDWFARFSPDGSTVIFNRSKRRWEPETNAKYANRWNIHQINVDGTGEKLLIENATWGTWTPDGKVLFSRGETAHVFDPATGEEKQIIDGASGLRRGVVLQQPQMSPDGKHVAITLRGRMRETGVWHLEDNSWTEVAGGCQINWFPSGKRMIRMNENTGRGGTEVFAFDVENGRPVEEKPSYDSLKFMDLPGRRSHEYFPKISKDGKWMVWCATARGHDHDIYDYEVHIWKIGDPAEKAARLTFHTCNDRWPDIYIPGAN